ncbi:hypothetical protein [Aquimarina longa]|uniref:hypothetical protein n=1 Tax=Aquimarina longa TaxID=1080221 RepID=UPI000784B280|nr:hypothetical protein [Aquimarina longa]
MKINKLFHLAIVAVLFLTVSCSKDSVADNSPITQEANILEKFESESTNKRSIAFPYQLKDSNLLGKWNLIFASDLDTNGSTINIHFSNNDKVIIRGAGGEVCASSGGINTLLRRTETGGDIKFSTFLSTRFGGCPRLTSGVANLVELADRYEIRGNRLFLFRVVDGVNKGVVFRR